MLRNASRFRVALTKALDGIVKIDTDISLAFNPISDQIPVK